MKKGISGFAQSPCLSLEPSVITCSFFFCCLFVCRSKRKLLQNSFRDIYFLTAIDRQKCSHEIADFIQSGEKQQLEQLNHKRKKNKMLTHYRKEMKTRNVLFFPFFKKQSWCNRSCSSALCSVPELWKVKMDSCKFSASRFSLLGYYTHQWLVQKLGRQ